MKEDKIEVWTVVVPGQADIYFRKWETIMIPLYSEKLTKGDFWKLLSTVVPKTQEFKDEFVRAMNDNIISQMYTPKLFELIKSKL